MAEQALERQELVERRLERLERPAERLAERFPRVGVPVE